MFDISDEKYEELRLILEEQNGQTYTLDEAKEIGEKLIEFYQMLMSIRTEVTDKNDQASS